MAKPTRDLLVQKDHILEAMKEELKLLRSEEGKALPEYERHILKRICQLRALNFSVSKICQELEVPKKNVKLILKSASIQREIARLQEDLWKDEKQVFRAHFAEATGTIYKLMKSTKTKDSTRIEAAKVILDRALGKAVQHVTQTTTLLKDVLIQLQDATQGIEEACLVPESKPTENQSQGEALKPKDPLEEILKE